MNRVNGYACFIGSGNPAPYLAKALEAMSHRAWNGYLINHGETYRIDNPRDILQIDIGTKAAVGYCLGGEGGGEASTPIHGRIYHSEDKSIPREIERLKQEPAELAETLRGVDGDYSFTILNEGGVVFSRDPLGVKPLFIGRREGLLGLASEAKALKDAGLDVDSVPPGFVYSADPTGGDRFLIRRIFGSDHLAIGLEKAAVSVLEVVQKSLERRLKGRRRVAVGFSGGVDSSLLALLASRLTDVRLVSVYAAGSRDEAGVEASARLLDLDIVEVCLDMDDVSRMVGGISSLVERSSVMDVAIGLAVNSAASAARDEGCDELILGQFADELFGGYLKYLRAYGDRGVESAQTMMENDVRLAYTANFERDEAAASPYSDLLLPYASCELTEYALSLHPRLKMNPERNERKIVLREAAVKAGVPEKIASKPKKALQFSSNLQKLVEKTSLEARKIL